MGQTYSNSAALEICEMERYGFDLINEARDLAKSGEFERAKELFTEALNYTGIQQNIDVCHIGIDISQQGIYILNADKLDDEAEELMKAGKYQEAILKYDLAYYQLSDTFIQASELEELVRACRSTIISHKATTYHMEGLSLEQQAWEAEFRNDEKECKNKLNKAKAAYQKALNLEKKSQYEKCMKIVDIKIEGNKIFNEALAKVKKAQILLKKTIGDDGVIDDLIKTRTQYKQAQKIYKKAKAKFEQGLKLGDKNFQASIDVTELNIKGIMEVIEHLDRSELEYNINGLDIEEDEEEKRDQEKETVAEKTLYKQIDNLTLK